MARALLVTQLLGVLASSSGQMELWSHNGWGYVSGHLLEWDSEGSFQATPIFLQAGFLVWRGWELPSALAMS